MFADNNLKSFQRQLNLYGFRRQDQYGKGTYAHPSFKRGYRDLTLSIRRITNQSSSSSSSNQISESLMDASALLLDLQKQSDNTKNSSTKRQNATEQNANKTRDSTSLTGRKRRLVKDDEEFIFTKEYSHDRKRPKEFILPAPLPVTDSMIDEAEISHDLSRIQKSTRKSVRKAKKPKFYDDDNDNEEEESPDTLNHILLSNRMNYYDDYQSNEPSNRSSSNESGKRKDSDMNKKQRNNHRERADRINEEETNKNHLNEDGVIGSMETRTLRTRNIDTSSSSALKPSKKSSTKTKGSNGSKHSSESIDEDEMGLDDNDEDKTSISYESYLHNKSVNRENDSSIDDNHNFNGLSIQSPHKSSRIGKKYQATIPEYQSNTFPNDDKGVLLSIQNNLVSSPQMYDEDNNQIIQHSSIAKGLEESYDLIYPLKVLTQIPSMGSLVIVKIPFRGKISQQQQLLQQMMSINQTLNDNQSKAQNISEDDFKRRSYLYRFCCVVANDSDSEDDDNMDEESSNLSDSTSSTDRSSMVTVYDGTKVCYQILPNDLRYLHFDIRFMTLLSWMGAFRYILWG